MPTQFTPKYAMPYPQPTDPVAQGADAIRKLAQSVENLIQAGQATLPSVAVGSNADAIITFPTPFAALPFISLVSLTTGPDTAMISVVPNTLTTAGFTLRGRRTSGTNAWDAQWIAVGKVGVVALAAADEESAPESAAGEEPAPDEGSPNA